MPSSSDYAAGPEHMFAFGRIIQAFARHEILMQCIMTRLLNTSLYMTIIVSAGLGYAGKRDALLALVRIANLQLDDRQRIFDFVDDLQKHSKLRNNIAHNSWIEGKRASAVKPMGLVRGPSARVIGIADNEIDYTPAELHLIADELALLHDHFRDFAQWAGLFPMSLSDPITFGDPTP